VPGLHQESEAAGKLLRPVAEAAREQNDDPTTLKFDGPVEVSDDDAGSDPYNRTGRFKRLIRG